MKAKKPRHESSSEDSDGSSVSQKSSSESDSEDSSIERRHKKKRKHADTSASESESDDQRRSKKRKHKKKKRKHSKKKRRANSDDESGSESGSDAETSKKKRKHKHKHKSSKRGQSSSPSIKEFSDGGERAPYRLHSVVNERRPSSDEGSQPARTYYQKEYRRSDSREDYERQQELRRFYRDSSKEPSRGPPHNEHAYDGEYPERYAQDKYRRERYDQNPPYNGSAPEFQPRPRDFDEYKRPPRYEPPPNEEYNRRPREEPHFSRMEDRGQRGFNRYNQQRGPRGRNFEENRDFQPRRGPPEENRFQGREFPDKRDRYREERFSQDRPRDMRRDRPGRPERPPPQHQSGHLVSDRSARPYNSRVTNPTPRSPPPRLNVPDMRGERVERGEHSRERPREERPREDRLREDRGREDRARGEGPRSRERKPDVSHSRDNSRPKERKSRFTDAEDKKDYQWGKTEVKKEGVKPDEKEKPNFGLSGKLTADANTVNGVVIKYTEPDDAKQPKRRWRFYPFKGDKALPILYIHRQSCFLLGRDAKVADIPLEHPSVSKQHAALQFRATPFTRADGSQGRRVRPYIIDLESANGTFVNNKKIEPRRYVELLERDVVKFGFSQREYVLLHENSKDDAQDDDHHDPPDIGANVVTAEQIKQDKRAKQVAAEDGD